MEEFMIIGGAMSVIKTARPAGAGDAEAARPTARTDLAVGAFPEDVEAGCSAMAISGWYCSL